MNAFTSQDHTSYPFATTNRKDFNNLLSVYLDATLHPLLNENDFTQEGWRIGPENPRAVTESQAGGTEHDNLVFKGVVYNEMKGQMSDASYLYYIKFQDHIFPDINNSGGDPQKMTSLTYSGLKDFHARNYHPSNAKLLTYGDMPLADHLHEIGRYLESFGRAKSDQTIKMPISLKDGPLNYTVKGPLDKMLDPDMQYKTSTSWLMGDASDILEAFSLRIVSSLLLDGYGSPLYQALIESGLGPDFSPNTGFDSAGKIGIFSVGLNGVRESDVPRVKSAIIDTFRKVHQKGFDQSKIEGILHQLELALKNKNANFGMGIIQRIQPGWFNGVDPFDALAWNDVVDAFKEKLSENGYLERLLEKYLLNERNLTFTMEPYASYGEDLASEENSRLRSKMSEAAEKVGGETKANEQLVARELELLKAQETASDQDLSSLPTLHVQDIPRQAEAKEVREAGLGSVKVQWREASTNGLTYFRAINRLEGLPTDLRMLIPLFTAAVMRLGTRDRSMEELEDLIKLKTGGIAASYHSSTSPNNRQSVMEGLSFSGYALDSNVPTMYEFLHAIILETNFDGSEAESKIKQLLRGDASGALDAISGSGHSYASRYAAAGLSASGFLSEQISGLSQVQQTVNLADRSPSEGLGDVMTKLKAIQQFAISNSQNFRAAITCGRESVSSNEAALTNFLSTLPPTSSILNPQPISGLEAFSPTTFFPMPYQVSYSAYAIPTVEYTHPSGAPLQILAQLLTHKHLHHEIREKGGAYGGGAYARGLNGLFGYYSYRDPNPQNTLKIMRDAGRWARDRNWTSQDLEEAKLSTFQSVDAPESVSDEGMTRFLSGVDEAMQQKRREQLLDVKKEDVQEVAQRFLVTGMKNGRVAVLGEKKDWVREEDGWAIKTIELSKLSETTGASDLAPGGLDHA